MIRAICAGFNCVTARGGLKVCEVKPLISSDLQDQSSSCDLGDLLMPPAL